MARPSDPAALIERRRAAQVERVKIGEDRWTAFQAANRKRYAKRPSRSLVIGVNPLAFNTVLARAKAPGRMLLLKATNVWNEKIDRSLGSTPGPTATLYDYVEAGPNPSFQPRALFDQSWYLEHAPLLAGSRWPPLAHYLVVGDRHGLSPHPLLDGPAYRARHGAEISRRKMTALEHFLFEGAAEGANPHPLFDLRYYVGQSDEVAASGENPLIHYLRDGWRQGLEPHPLFAGAWYLARHAHAQAAGVAPLLHYVTVGVAEGLDPHPLFDVGHYRKGRPAGLKGEPLSHFLGGGARGRKSPTPHFNPAFYLEQAGDRPLARANPLQHYLTLGAFEGLWPAPDFDEGAYLAAHPGAADEGLSGLAHWALHRTERPATGPHAAGRTVLAGTLFADLTRATDPDPEAYDNDAYATLRRPRRHAGATTGVQVIALRRAAKPDWVKVARALPNFSGHLQPRLPADGFTDPADPAVLKRDIALAERYGLAGFCHEVSTAAQVRAVTGGKAPAFAYSLAWTGPKDAAKALAALAPALGGAMTIDARPVVLADRGIDPKAWRAAAGKGGLFLIQRGGKPAAGFDARLADVDAPRAPDGPPGPVINPDFRGPVHDARTLIAERMAGDPKTLPLVVAAHDTTPLSQDAPTIWHGASPGAFQAWLEAARDAVAALPEGRRLVFVHAWNDWESGAALSPDLRFGHGWLEAVANAADADLLTPP